MKAFDIIEMPNLYIGGIEELYFRANPAYQIIAFQQLSDNQRRVVEELTEDSDFYGLLLPRQQNGLSVKSIDRNTALLYRKLKSPTLLPAYLKSKLGKELNKIVSNLVFENILEVRIQDAYVSGLDAFDKSKKQIRRRAKKACNSVIERISIEALKYAQSLEINNISELAARIYLYGCRPLTPFWRKQFPTPESLQDFWRIYPDGNLRQVLKKYETDLTNDFSDKYWINWKHAEFDSKTKALTYKLYVSPDYKILRDVLPFIFESFSANNVGCFKLGRDLRGVLRPDKIIAYFEDANELKITAENLKSKLVNCPAHGVPFTSAITDDGFLSWAIDPPESERIFNWQQDDSWRTWIAKRLSTAIIEAKVSRQEMDIEPWQYALEHIRLQGIDIQSWLPTDTLWANKIGMA